jgi:4a-hydroxytetrahydrobiopterin dehydratase
MTRPVKNARPERPPTLTPLTRSQLAPLLKTVPRWHRRGMIIARVYKFRDFAAALAFVNRVARVAERHGHHPDIDIRWNRVTLAQTSHEAGGLAELDLRLARLFDAAATRLGAR